MKKIIIILLLNVWLIGLVNASSKDFVTISDIHFNPFNSCKTDQPCELISKLRGASPENWDALFANYDTAKPTYNNDTGYRLLKSTFFALSREAKVQHAKFVLVLGDFLVHDFKKLYHSYTTDLSDEGCNEFNDKAMRYVNLQLRQVMPDLNIYAAVGNNDTYGEHYSTDPRYFKQQLDIWSQLIIDPKNQQTMKTDFVKAGYYAVSPVDGLRLIVLNSNYFSALAEDTKSQALMELDWFHQQLQTAVANKERVLIAMHIPPNVDVYKTIKNMEVNLQWQKKYARRFRKELRAFSQSIIAILPGHIHMDWWQVIKVGDAEIPMSGTPGISPLFGNNPAYKIYDYEEKPLRLVNYTTYYAALTDSYITWKKEYEFDKTYLHGEKSNRMLAGMDALKQAGELAEIYKSYYAVGRDAQPITTENKWLPYYWCAIHFYTNKKYSACLTNPM